MSWNTFEAALFGFGQMVFVAYFVLFFLSVCIERKVSSTVISLLAAIQTLRYIDRYVTSTEFLQPLYQYGIPILNIVLVPLLREKKRLRRS